MKKLLVNVLVICTMTAFCACGGNVEEKNDTPAQDTQVVAENTEAVVEETPAVETEVVDDGKVDYTVTVVDEDGNPIAGALVQLCKESCFPSATDADGVARFSLVEEDYKVSFLTLPAGYTYSGEEQEFYFEDGAVELTITLKPEA